MLRDRRTLTAMIGVPMVLYPALFVFGSQAAMMQQNKIESTPSRIAVVGKDAVFVSGWFSEDPQLSVAGARGPVSAEIQAVVVLPDNFRNDVESGRTAHAVVEYDAAEPASYEASRRVVDAMDKQFEQLLKARLDGAGLPETFADPIEVETKNVAPPAKATGAMLGMMLPLIMIVMVGVGAFYPAIDLTAGEKERGTFETLLSTPTLSTEILAGKFLTVFCIAMITGLTNLGSMVATFAFQLSQMGGKLAEYEISFPLRNVALIFAALVPLAFLISAVMMSIAVLARSFREAQTLLTPVLILMIFPAALAAIPGTSLTTATQFLPIANFSLLFKDLMTEHISTASIAAVLISTTLYALLALAFAARVFQREEVVLSVENGLPVTLRRSMYRPRALPTPGTSVFILVLCLLLFFYVGTWLQTTYGLAGVALSQWFLFLAPAVFILWYVRVDLRSAFSLRPPTPLLVIAAVLLGIGWAIINLHLSVLQQRVFPFPESLAEEITKMLRLDEASIFLLIGVLAFSPAICEELLFRGAVMSGLRKLLPAWALFLCVGLAFGAAHMSVHKLGLTTLSGVLLTYIAWRTGSIFPGMIAHVLVNATSVLIDRKYMPASILKITDPALGADQGFPIWILAIAFAFFVCAILIIERTARSRP